MPYIEYDDAERKIEVERAETEAHRGYVDIEMRAEEIKNDEPLLRYFLDGSRHVYKVDDIAYHKKVFPVMAGQVGVGCLKRIDKRMHCAAFARKWVVALPSYSNADGIDDKSFFAGLSNTLNERLYSGGIASGVYPAGEACFEVAMYKPPVQAKGQKKVSLEDKATAVIQDCMMREEKRMVSELAGQKVLGHSAYLV